MISVVLPARNAASTIARQLGALAEQDYQGSWEIIVVDNGSTDETRAVAEAFVDRLPRLRVLDGSGRRGSAYARMRGVAAASGCLLAFCDADDEVSPHWLSALVVALESAEVVVGRVSPASGDEGLVALPGVEQPVWDAPYLGFLPVYDTCNLAMRTSVIERFGGFDPAFRYSSDVELAWRVQLGGLRAAPAPDAVVLKSVRTRPWPRLVQQWKWARYHPRLYRMYRDRGVQRSSPARAVGAYFLLAVEVPLLWWKPVRAAWITRLAFRGGRLAGSLAEGVLYL